MPYTVLQSFGDQQRVAGKFKIAAKEAEPTYLRMALLEIAQNMRLAEDALFRSQGRRGGGSWKQLKDDTVQKKGMSKIMFTEGSRAGYSDLGNNTLYLSLTQEGAPYSVLNIVGYDLEFGTDRPYAELHQTGKGGMPKREIMRFTPFDRRRWNNILNRHLMRPWAGTVPTRSAYRSLSADQVLTLRGILQGFSGGNG